MDLQIIIIVLLIAVLVGLGIALKFLSDIKSEALFAKNKFVDNSGLQLQAYERLALFAERAGLKNMVNRAQPANDSLAAMHIALTDDIKTEFNYNVSQQVYVTPEVWNSVVRLKDQNIYIVNQIAATLPQGATGKDLARSIVEYSINDGAELNQIVQEAIQFEAKKLL